MMTSKINRLLAGLIWIVSCTALMIESSPFYGFLILLPFVLFPHCVSHILIYRLTTGRSQAVLLVGQLAFFGWFMLIYLDAFYVNPDPQSSIGLLFVGVYSLPVMLPVWLVANFYFRKDTH